MHSPNHLYADISLLKIITAIPSYLEHQKKMVLLPLYDISFNIYFKLIQIVTL